MIDNLDKLSSTGDWAGTEGELGSFIYEESKKTLDSYRSQPNLLTEHANLEEDVTHGGYAGRQLFELVQNSADALIGRMSEGRIEIRLTEKYLYCADNGKPIDENGVTALMFSHMSPKRRTGEIGRFGLGFKSVLGVTDAPEFFSRSGSFCFNRQNSRMRILQAVGNDLRSTDENPRFPALRLPSPIDPEENSEKDKILLKLMGWATNIVRLPLKSEAHVSLGDQIRKFPPEFLLFVQHVSQLTLKDGWSDSERNLELLDLDGQLLLADGDNTSEWKLFKHTHQLSGEALADFRSLDDGEEVPIWWAVPLERLSDPGQFWAFFPTKAASLVAGILNAPWKTNEDRQNLLPGPYNDELIRAAAGMVARELPGLATESDPAQHLDALPRRHESGDSEQVELLREELFSGLSKREIIPDQNGRLCVCTKISYPPKNLDMESLERWEAYPGRPSNWTHYKALTRNRLAAIDRLFDLRGFSSAPSATLAKWLEALTEQNVTEGSKAALQTAALVPPHTRSVNCLGDIVLTVGGKLKNPDPERIFLPEENLDAEHVSEPDSFVHPNLVSDGDTLAALKELGIRSPSAESGFKLIASDVLNRNYTNPPSEADLIRFWEQSRKAGDRALDIIKKHYNWMSDILVRTRSGDWMPIHSALLPGEIVPGDGTRDDDTAVDVKFHEPDAELLRGLGITEGPQETVDLSTEPWYQDYLSDCRRKFTSRDLSSKPRSNLLKFESTVGSGPLSLLTKLSYEGRALYTEALLSLDVTYKPWTMRHETRDIYEPWQCESPAVHLLRKDGRIRIPGDIVPFEDALGSQPKSVAALYALLALPLASKIKLTFALAEPVPEFVGEEDPVPLTDIWPGLEEYLPARHKALRLIRCERILVGPEDLKCFFASSDVYVIRADGQEEDHELRLVSNEIGLDLDESQIYNVLRYRIRREIEERRGAVSKCSTDAARLLEAVGEQALRDGLPGSLLDILESEGSVLNPYYSRKAEGYRKAKNSRCFSPTDEQDCQAAEAK